ncbi:MAG: class I SAM-dependent methyltransferase [Anaerolineales bacterium]
MSATQVVDRALQLYRGSPLKRQKWTTLREFIGSTAGLDCLDIGSDNGVISYFLRRGGGRWKSADLDQRAVETIRRLVREDVYQIDGQSTPFGSNEFDQIVILDFFEHIETDREFVQELYRIIKSDGALVVNVPHWQSGMVRIVREALNQGDEAHGHVRPGYSLNSLEELLSGFFSIEEHRYYSGLFGHMFDTLLAFAFSLVRRAVPGAAKKGNIVTDQDLDDHRALFMVYRLMFPVAWLITWLDSLPFVPSNHMLIVRARRLKDQQSTLG